MTKERYTLEFSLEDKFIEVSVDGIRNEDTATEDAVKALIEIETYASKFKKCSILIKWEINGTGSKDIGMEILSKIESLAIDKSFKVAVYFSNSENIKTNQLIEMLALKLNWKVAFFNKLEPAQEWIKSDLN